ncbi:MAG: hypothetical protein HN377_13115 [Alphaproteobacteria bacterium]|jgi:DnaJ homolog subfamily C member 19|nr:hypothetical protein [Alphaproteobacteria bacterium]MBT7942722.1 hypothetical protein [Alphaproteobacteria bacterium]
MLHLFILGLVVLAGLLLAGRWFTTADPKTLIKVLRILLFGVIGAAALFFIVTGRLAWAFVAIPALIPWFMRARTVHRAYRNFSGAASGNSGPQNSSGPMTRAQALEILGLQEGATEAEIRDAHHRLIAAIHPDHGGSTYLAAQINQAKDVLIPK